MSGAQTQNFDVLYEIATSRFLEALKNLLIDDLPLRLGHVDFDVPLPGAVSGLTQNGFISLPGRPTPSFALDAGAGANNFTLTIQLPASTLTLLAVPAVGGVLGFAGLAGAAKTTGLATLTLHLAIDSTGGGSPIAIRRAAATALTLDLSALSAAPAIAFPAGSSLTAMVAAVLTAAQNAVIAAVESLLPVDVPIALPGSGPCNIRPREIKMKFLPGDSGHVESIAFGLALRTASVGAGTLPGLTVSRVETGSEGALVVANDLLRDLICCLLPSSPGISGLPATPTSTPPGCCRWENINNVSFGGQTFPVVEFLQVCVGTPTSNIAVNSDLIQRGTGWWARAHVELRIGLRHSGTAILPTNAVAPVVTVDANLEWWVWVLIVAAAVVLIVVGAIVGFFIGGPLGAATAGTLIGAGIGLLIGGLIAAAIIIPLYGVLSLVGTTVGMALGSVAGTLAALQLLPADLTQAFGSLELLNDPVIDDLTLGGRILLPDHHGVQSEAADVILDVGSMIDLDHGTLFRLSDSVDLDADIEWFGGKFELSSFYNPTKHHGTQLWSRGSARLVSLHRTSFYSLTEGDVAGLHFPSYRGWIAGSAIPVTDQSNPPTMAVFAVRTTEGRFAKCGAWVDPRGRLHLRYRTWDTARPLFMSANWTVTLGEVVGGGNEGFLPYVEHQVAWHGVFRAHTETLHVPISFRWFWNGAEISGNGTVPDGDASFITAGGVCDLWTPMGSAIEGDLCVTAQDATGYEVTVCRAVSESGTKRVYDTSVIDQLRNIHLLDEFMFRLQPPLPDPPPDFLTQLPLEAQLPAAIANGMNMDVSKVVLR